MSSVLLITVPHTGTTFVEYLLKEHGYTKYALHDEPDDEKAILAGHLGPDERYQAALAAINKGGRLIITMRHPYLVEKSWIGRNKRPWTLIEGFKQLDEIYKKHNPLVLPVDSLKWRDKCLHLLGSELGLDLSTTWTPKNISQGTYQLSPGDVTPSAEIYELAQSMKIMELYD